MIFVSNILFKTNNIGGKIFPSTLCTYSIAIETSKWTKQNSSHYFILQNKWTYKIQIENYKTTILNYNSVF